MSEVSDWDVFILRTPQEQSLGAKQFKSPLPVNYLLLFQSVIPGSVINMEGVYEGLRIYFLDNACHIVGAAMLWPGQYLPVLEGASHFVEISAHAQPPKDFNFLIQYLD